MTGRLESLILRLPGFARRRIQYGIPSAFLYFAFLWTAILGAVYTAAAAAGMTEPVAAFFSVPALVIGLLGLRLGTSFSSLIPAMVAWPVFALVSFGRAIFVTGIELPLLLLVSISFLGCLAIGVWTLIYWHVHASWSRTDAESSVNQLGWDLYRLSTKPPINSDSTEGVVAYSALRVGEVERHFDQVTYAAIRGGMQHTFRFKGTSSTLHGLPKVIYQADTASWMRMRGTGESSVQLGMEGRSTADLTDDAFVAVFERPGSDGVDTVRGVVPSERQAQAYVNQLLTLWSSQLAPNSEPELMIRRYAAAISQGVSTESSYVGDRLNAVLRMPAAERPEVTVIGEPLNHHAVLVSALRFSANGPLYQLFPTALVHALVALMEGRPLPPPPSGPPLPEAGSETETASVKSAPIVAGSNGHTAQVAIRTLGGLRIEADGAEVTSALLDRKVLAFLWLQLLARKLRNPNETITRASLADELSPGIDASSQRSRLRGRLSELRKELPAGLGRRVEVSGERIAFNLVGCDIDVMTLLDAARTEGGSNGILSAEQLQGLEAAVRHTGTFLPEWDDLERDVNGARGGAGQVVADLRLRIDTATTTLLRTIGAAYLTRGRADDAVASLERALEISPDDEAVARVLMSACVQTGRMARAEALRKDFALV